MTKKGQYRDPLLDSYDEPQQKKLTPADAPMVLKALVLVCICCMQLGTYYSSDIPGAIQKQLTQWFAKDGYDYTEQSNSLLYSIYSWPNCVLPLFGGILIDRILGIRKSVMIFIACIVIGQLVFSFGVSNRTYWMCVLGRLILGLGGENLGVSQNQFCVRWFKGPSLAVIFGIVLASARLGSSINFILTPRLAEQGVNVATWTASGITIFSFFMCLCLVIVDYANSKYVETETENKEGEQEEEEGFSIKALADFPRGAWILFAICATFYVGVIILYQFISVIIQETSYHFSPSTATLMLSIPNLLSIVCSPTFGQIIDKKGFTVYGLIGASLTMVLVQIGFLSNAYGVFLIHPALLMFVLGVAYSIGATMWTLVPKLVSPKQVSTGYGLMTSIQNISLSIFPMLISSIQLQLDGSIHKYAAPVLVFMTCLIVAAALSTWLATLDVVQYAGALNMSSQEYAKMQKAQEEQGADDITIG